MTSGLLILAVALTAAFAYISALIVNLTEVLGDVILNRLNIKIIWLKFFDKSINLVHVLITILW